VVAPGGVADSNQSPPVSSWPISVGLRCKRTAWERIAFQIQSRDKDARTLQYRLRWINDASGITTVLRDDLETEGGARYELLRKLEAWSRSKQFIFKGKLR
jgi:hypothetical protein